MAESVSIYTSIIDISVNSSKTVCTSILCFLGTIQVHILFVVYENLYSNVFQAAPKRPFDRSAKMSNSCLVYLAKVFNQPFKQLVVKVTLAFISF